MITSIFNIAQSSKIEQTNNKQYEKTMLNFSNESFYEQWKKTYGGSNIDVGYSVQQTNDNGYIVAGYTRSYGNISGRNIWLVKTDSSGNEIWNKTFGGNDDEEGESVQQTNDGGYIIAGYTKSFGAGMKDVILIKTDASGNQEWMKIFGGTNDEEGYSVQQTTDGGYIIAGATSSFATGGRDMWVIKTNTSGDAQWTRSIGGLQSDGAFSVQQTTDGGYILTGWTFSYGTGYLGSIWLVKIDELGYTQWHKVFGGTDADRGYAVQQTSDGGYIITGYTGSFGAGLYDLILIKTDESGNQTWMKTFGGTGRDYGNDVKQTTDGGYITVGYTLSYGSGGDDVWVIKTDTLGNEQYNATYGGTSSDVAYAVQQTNDGGYIICGHTLSFGAGVHDVWLIKITEETFLDIQNITAMPIIQETPGWVNISCCVLSSNNINNVTVNVTKPDDNYINQSMDNILGTDIFYLNNSYSLTGDYDYYIWVNTDNEQKSSNIFHFYIGSDYIYISLTPGWNLVTVPVDNGWYASDLVSNISGCSYVVKWDNVDQEFWIYVPGFPAFDFPLIPGHGYFVEMSNTGTLIMVDSPITSVNVSLKVSVNLIGWYHNQNTTASSILENISNCSSIIKWDQVVQDYWLYLPGYPAFDFVVTQGMGLFVDVDQESYWHGEG
ncbi:MAG: hypothetical protein BV457_08145 [Thermoplasmata archaeon M9B1D]|nr:MAG: hypothetical protein BV457_08145 [Thermoplasmata archaeon M9B1D]